MSNEDDIYIYYNNLNFYERVKGEERFLKNNKYLTIIFTISINRQLDEIFKLI